MLHYGKLFQYKMQCAFNGINIFAENKHIKAICWKGGWVPAHAINYNILWKLLISLLLTWLIGLFIILFHLYNIFVWFSYYLPTLIYFMRKLFVLRPILQIQLHSDELINCEALRNVRTIDSIHSWNVQYAMFTVSIVFIQI